MPRLPLPFPAAVALALALAAPVRAQPPAAPAPAAPARDSVARDSVARDSVARDSVALERVVITATRAERRLEDTPLRVEVVEEEEIEEKIMMTPGDIAMLLNETSGLRVQTTSPSLGGAGVRVQGLRGRYTQLLADGLPLYGGQAGALGLLQIPPLDLGRVEIVKGAASALYGASALGGVVNLVSRRPGEEHERELLLNATSRGGRDGVLFAAGPLPAGWGYTVLAGGHAQDVGDLDRDGWADLARHRRVVVRPRLVHDDGRGRTLLLTAGATGEERAGGTLAGRTVPGGAPFVESLDTRRGDVGAALRLPVGQGLVGVRGSFMAQRHEHGFGPAVERDRHATGFAEATWLAPRERWSWLVGAALQHDAYRARDLPAFDYTYTVPALLAQVDAEPARWLALSGSARLDAHDVHGTFVNPRLSALLRAADDGGLAGWTLRASAGTGVFAPTPFTEETEVVGLGALLPPGALRPERAVTGSLDVGGPVGALEVHATLFGSVVRRPLHAVEAPDAPAGAACAPSCLRLVNAAGPTRTAGTELVARYVVEPWHVTASWTYLRATEAASPVAPPVAPAVAAGRRDAPYVPRHAAGLVAMHEREGAGRVGLEVYYTGRQALADDPFRARSRPYLVIGALVEQRVGPARLFLNFENLTDVRQTRWDPLLRPAPGPGGRWTTDAWTELVGRTVNGGVRLAL